MNNEKKLEWVTTLARVGNLSEQLRILRQSKGITAGEKKAIAALMDKLEGGVPFPVRLNNTEQGLFLEGYYHQMRDKFRRIEEAKQNKENSEEA